MDFLENGYVRVKRCRHGLFMYLIHDQFVSRSLDLYGEWAEAELAFIAPYIKPGDVVLDIGAHIGNHTIFFANQVGKTGQVLAFEPQRFLFHMLGGNVTLNNLQNVKCWNLAVGAARGMIEMPVVDPETEYNFGAISINSGVRGDPVQLVPVDALELTRCNFIKADVEGVETDVVEGARQTIARLKPVLFLENDNNKNHARLYEKVREIGYQAFWQISPYYSADNYAGATVNIFEKYQPNANILCLPSGTPADGLMPVTGPEDTWQAAQQRLASLRGRP